MINTSGKNQYDDFLFFLRNHPASRLPGQKAHLELIPYRKEFVEKQELPPNPRLSAVAVIIGQLESDPVILLTRRVNYKGVHGGQVSFPGGKAEMDDVSLRHTAIRETHEETGLTLRENDYICELSSLYIPPSNFNVTPFMFSIKDFSQVNINYEVDSLIRLPLFYLRDLEKPDEANIILSNGVQLKNAPCFFYNNQVIWGATAAILNELRWLLREWIST